jgi:hypothetical protein
MIDSKVSWIKYSPGVATNWLVIGTSNDAKTGEWSLETISFVQPEKEFVRIDNW